MKPLLSTALQPPQIAQDVIERESLFDLLDQFTSNSLTLVTAPAGYGKTTLLISWLAQNQISAAWLSIQTVLDTPHEFYRYLVASLRRCRPTIGEKASSLLESPQPPGGETIGTLLLNDVAELTESVLIVLDDFHLITAPEILTAVSWMIEKGPPNLHFVISSRMQLPWPVSKLRADGRLMEVSLSDFCLTSNEAAEFLRKRGGPTLSETELCALLERSEGWITGLQLTALAHHHSLQGSVATEAATDSERFVYDYLWDEVLQQQQPNVRSFLLQTAFLDSFTHELCDAVTQSNDAARVLDYLCQNNLFTITLNDKQSWFRYHHLFQDYLHTKASQGGDTLSASLKVRYQRAATWYINTGEHQKGIEYGLKAENFDWVAQQIAYIGDQMWTHDEMRQLLLWTDSLPDDIMGHYPKTALLRGWAALILGDMVGVAKAVNLVGNPTNGIKSDETPNEPDDEIAGIWSILQSALVRPEAPSQTIELYETALEKLPQALTTWRSAAYIGLAFTHLHFGNLSQAQIAFRNATSDSAAAGNQYGAIYTQFHVGQIHLEQGQLQDAETIFALAIQQAGGDHASSPAPIIGWPYLGMGSVLYEKDNLADASKHLLSALQHGRLINETEIIVRSLLLLARIEQNQGQYAQADSLIRQAMVTAHQGTGPQTKGLVTRAKLAQIDLALARNHTASLEPWVQEVDRSLHALGNIDNHPALMMLARVSLHQNRLEDASQLIDALSGTLPKAYHRARLKVTCLRSLLHFSMGQTTQAIKFLDFPIRFGYETGHCRLFLDFGQSFMPLFQAAAEHYATSQAPEDKPLATLCNELSAAGANPQPDIPPGAQALIEPLSSTELAILRLLALGLSNQQIADTRVISITTVKWHLKNIYGKLSVRNRTAAVARAQELSLL